jgi:hypothetical protein
MNKKYIPLILGLIVFIVSAVLYIKTLAPTVWFIDSGELAAVCTTLGIAHPTGYPLFTLIGHLFTILPLAFTHVYKLNLMNAFLCPLAAFVFVFLMRYIFLSEDTSLYDVKPAPQKKKASNKPQEHTLNIHDPLLYGLLLFSSLMLVFDRTFWGIVRSGKVYPLHVFFIITLMLFFLKAVIPNEKRTYGNSITFTERIRYYMIFAFVLGLSFTNHLTTILLAPACIVLFIYANYERKKDALKILGGMILFFILGFSVYIYLPVRDSMNPIFIWGDPRTLERFIWHFTAKQFNVWIFSGQGSVPSFLFLIAITIFLSVIGLINQGKINKNLHFLFFVIIALVTYFVLSAGTDTVQRQFLFFRQSSWIEFGPGLVLIALAGIYRLSRYNLIIYYFTLLTFFSCIFYAVNYDIFDIYSYFLLAYITMVIWLGFGALLFYELARQFILQKPNRIAYSAVLIAVCFIPLLSNYEANDESKNYYVEQYTMNIFENVDPGGIVLSSQWDFWVSPSWYYQFVEHIRPDIIVIDKELLRRSWYYKYIEHNYPEIYNNSRKEIERFLAELYKFEHGIPYDQQTITQAYSDLLTSFVTRNTKRSFYCTWEIEQNRNEPFAMNYVRIPTGLLFQLINKEAVEQKTERVFYKLHDFQFTPIEARDYYYNTLMYAYGGMLTNSAKYLASIGKFKEANYYLDKALTAMPNYKDALELRKLINNPN